MQRLVVQIGAVQIEPVTPRMLRVHAGSDQPVVIDAIQRGRRSRRHEALLGRGVRLRQPETKLRAATVCFDARCLGMRRCDEAFSSLQQRPIVAVHEWVKAGRGQHRIPAKTSVINHARRIGLDDHRLAAQPHQAVIA